MTIKIQYEKTFLQKSNSPNIAAQCTATEQVDFYLMFSKYIIFNFNN